MPRRARMNLQRARGTSAAPASARSDPRPAEEIRGARASRSFLPPYRIVKMTPTPFTTRNEDRAAKLHQLLKEKYPHIPSFQRIYDGGGRHPPLFSGY